MIPGVEVIRTILGVGWQAVAAADEWDMWCN